MTEPRTIYKKRGGFLIRGGVVEVFGRELYIPYFFSASWPFAKLECRPDSLTISVWPIMLVIQVPTEDIEYVQFKAMSLLTLPLGDTLTIRHRHRDAPNPIVFGAYRDLRQSILVLDRMGISIKEGALPRRRGQA